MRSAKVIVLASGTKGIDGECMYGDGTVHDSHAEIVARRSLMVYFYNQLELLCDGSVQGEKNPIRLLSFLCSSQTKNLILLIENQAQSIFMRQKDDINSRYRLKDGIQFHLFTSRAPCGDATAYYCKNISEM